MDKKIIMGVGVVAVLGVDAFFFITGKAHAPENGMGEQQERNSVTEGAFAPALTQTENGTGSFRKLLGLGKSLSCAVSYTSTDTHGAGTYDGTVYVSGQKMRMEFTSSVGDVSMKSNVINDGTQGYMWGSTAQGTMAIKFPIDATQTSDAQKQKFNLDQNVNYNCKNWSVDESMFVPPADLKFMDMGAMMKQAMPKGTEGIKNAQCATCNQITDNSAKAQCLQTLSCN